jgi:phospholipase/carboxylesterase
MANPPRLDGPRMPPAYGGPPRQLVILLHGYGADGNDLISLGGYWKARLPGAAFVAPNGPENSEVVPQGRQWFSLGNYDPNKLRRDPAAAAAEYDRREVQVEKAAPALNAFIDSELDRYGLDESSLALVGFSQGTMMSLHVGLRRERQFAAVIGFSGALCGASGTPIATRSRPPVFLFHGDADEVVPIHALFLGVEGLAAAGVSVEWHICNGIGHGIAPDALELSGRFMADAFSGARQPAEVIQIGARA